MLLNNLDPGGRRASRGARRLRRLGPGGPLARGAAGHRPDAAAAARRRDAARPIRQAGGRLPDARGRAARVDRELAARAEVGDLGRVPPARGGGADDVRSDDGRVVDLHRHPGDPPGHLPDVLRRRRGALRLGRSRRAHGAHCRPRRDGRGAAARGDDGRGGDSLRRGRSAVDRPSARDAVRRRAGLVPRRCGLARAGCGGRGKAAVGGAARERGGRVPGARGARRALRSRHRPDGGPRSADGICAGGGAVRGGRCASRPRPEALPRARLPVDRDPRSRDVRLRPDGLLCFRLWQQSSRGGLCRRPE